MNTQPCAYVLLIVDKSSHKNITAIPDPWETFLQDINKDGVWFGANISERKNPSERLAENVWLLPLQDGLPILGRVAAMATSNGFRYSAYPLDRKPEWSQSPQPH
jgi:hypothetical protein